MKSAPWVVRCCWMKITVASNKSKPNTGISVTVWSCRHTWRFAGSYTLGASRNRRNTATEASLSAFSYPRGEERYVNITTGRCCFDYPWVAVRALGGNLPLILREAAARLRQPVLFIKPETHCVICRLLAIPMTFGVQSSQERFATLSGHGRACP